MSQNLLKIQEALKSLRIRKWMYDWKVGGSDYANRREAERAETEK